MVPTCITVQNSLATGAQAFIEEILVCRRVSSSLRKFCGLSIGVKVTGSICMPRSDVHLFFPAGELYETLELSYFIPHFQPINIFPRHS